MSSPSTPSRSLAGSAASTPGDSYEPDPLQLTPRSKIKAMMDAIDEDLDDEPANGAKGSLSRHALLQSNIHTGNINVASKTSSSGVYDNNDNSEEDEIVMPRGKLAARLQKSGYRSEPPLLAEGSSPGIGAEEPHPDGTETETASHNGRANDDSEGDASRSISPVVKPAVKGRFLLRKKLHPVERDQPAADSEPLQRSESPLRDPLSPMPGRSDPADDLPGDSDSDSENKAGTDKKARFLALVARKREERQAKEAAEEKKRVERQTALEASAKESGRGRAISFSEDGTEDEDMDVGHKLTQQSRPSRKASKKALEEMSRETQRMSRNMQLAHECKVKKKFTVADYLERFKKNKPAAKNSPIVSSAANSSLPGSDVEGPTKQQTPPTSPLQPDVDSKESQTPGIPAQLSLPDNSLIVEVALNQDLSSLDDIYSGRFAIQGKGKGKAIEQRPDPQDENIKVIKKATFTQGNIKVYPPKNPIPPSNFGQDSDSDLEILPNSKPAARKLDVFDRLPAKKASEGNVLLKLRALAHLASPGKKGHSKSSMTAMELQVSLQRRARRQAAAERVEKIQDLKDRGIIIQTAEEREREQVQVEDMLEKARREGEELTKREKAAAKKQAQENGEEVEATSDEDEEYEEEEEEEEAEADFSAPELSGSEEELDGAEEIEDNGNGSGAEPIAPSTRALIDDEAEDDDGDVENGRDENSSQDELSEVDFPIAYNKRRSNNRRVVDEDDDQENSAKAQTEEKPPSPKSAKNPFAAADPDSNAAPMGLTQAFAATMADSQILGSMESQEQDSIAILRGMPAPDLSMFHGETQVEDTREESAEVPEIDLHFPQAQLQQDEPLLTQIPTGTQYSELPDPTQDGGFGISSPIKSRFVPAPASTIDTVVVSPAQVLESPIAKKRGRLHRRADAMATFLDEEGSDAHSEAGDAEFEIPANAFDVMKKKPAKKLKADAEDFDKKKSDARKMVEEQAEESEDEYAGLGGASDDESGGEEDEEVKKMIDEGEVDVDERQLAAFYADKERATDEKAVEKLFKDINNGMLRRKRGAEFDLSDSDDDIEDRRRRKRAREQRMRNALLQNESIGKIAEDPKKLAFLRAIEDHDDEEDDDDDMNAGFVEGNANDSQGMLSTQEVPESQIETADGIVGESDEPGVGNNNNNNNSNKRKRNALEESDPPAGNRRPAPHLRRTATREKKPTSLADIRASVSFLTEDPHDLGNMMALSDDESANEQEEQQQQQHQQQGKGTGVSAFTSRRRGSYRPNSSSTFVDRLSLKRTESANAAMAGPEADMATSARLAFHDATALSAAPHGFRVPSLLRRATTQLSAFGADANGISHGTGAGARGAAAAAVVVGTERAAGGEKGDFVRRGGTKRSSVNFVKREAQRRGAADKVEQRREEGRRKVAEGRRGVLLQSLGAGRWE